MSETDRSKSSKAKSKKSIVTSTGFISFSAVTEASSAVSKAFLQPVYTGTDSELAQASKKLIKKDSTTKLKALTEVVHILQSRDAFILHDFLPYFIYVYCRLSIDNDRQVRELINTVLSVIVSMDKKQLTPYMNKLIGYWWVLGCDTTREVAAKASSAFKDAIPSKKVQQVTAYLAPHILNRCLFNLHTATPATLSETDTLTADEAEERFERVVVSSLASVSKLISSLDGDQNLLLLAGVECAKEGERDDWTPTVVGYGDILNDVFWGKYLLNKSVAIRRAAYELVSVVAAKVPQFIGNCASMGRTAKQFATSIMALLDDHHSSNVSAAMDAFVSVVRACPSTFWEHVSVHKQVVPKLKHLLRVDPDRGLEYIVPVVGSLLSADVAVCTPMSTPDIANWEESDRNVDAVCGLLRYIGELAETLSAAPGGQSGANLLASVKADVCVCEMATLLLLRRDSTRSWILSSLDECGNALRLRGVMQHAVQSVVLSTQNVAAAIAREIGGSRFLRHWAAVNLLSVQWSGDDVCGTGLGIGKNAVVEAAEAVSRVLTTLQRATDQEINLSRALWDSELWSPLGAGIRSLLLASFTPEFTLSNGEESLSELPVEAVAINASSVTKAVFFLVDPAMLMAAGADLSIAVSGAHLVVEGLIGLSVDSFASMAHDAESLLSSKRKIETQLISIVKHLILSKFLTSAYTHAAQHRLGSVLGALQVTAERVMDLLSGPFARTVVELLSNDDSGAAAGNRSDGQPLPVLLETMAAHSLSDSFQFLCAHFQSNQDRAKFTSRILKCSVQAGSVYTLNAFLGCGELSEQFDWAADVALLEWISAAAQHFLSSNGTTSISKQLDQCSLSSKLSFLALVTQTSALHGIADECWAAAVVHWRANSSRLAIRYLLSVLANSLRKASSVTVSNGKSVLASSGRDAASFLTGPCSADGLLETRLSALFFGRTRNSRGTPIEKRHLAVSVGEPSVLVVDSWDAFQTILLPLLPRNVGDRVVSRLAGLLSAQFVGAEGEDRALLEDEAIASVSGGCGGNGGVSQPARWVRNLCALADLAKITTHTSVGVRALLSGEVALFQVSFWSKSFGQVLCVADLSSSDRDALQGRVRFALECLTQVQESIGKQDVASNLRACLPLASDRLLFMEILTCLEALKMGFAGDSALLQLAQSAGEFLVGLFFSAPIVERALWLENVLDVAFLDQSTSDTSQKARSSCVLAAIHRILTIQFGDAASTDLHISLRTPSATERLEKGQSLWYIQSSVEVSSAEVQSSSSSSLHFSEQHYTLQRVAARVLAVHKETGSDPYYSIETTGPAKSGGDGGGRELQTEWHKLLLSGPGHGGESPEHFSVVTATTTAKITSPTDVSGSLRTFLQTSRCGRGAPFDGVDASLSWLEGVLNALFHVLFDATSLLRGVSGGEWSQLLHGIKTFCLVFERVCCALEHGRHLPALMDRFSTLLARTRGLCCFLLALNHNLQWRAWSVGCELLTTLTSTRSGIGGGLWLLKAISSLKSVMAIELKLQRVAAIGRSAQDTAKLDQLFATLCGAMGAVLSSARCPVLVTLAEQLLPVALPSLPSSVLALAPSLLQLLRCVWANRVDTRSKDGHSTEKATSGEFTQETTQTSNVLAIEGNALLDSFVAAWEVEGFDLALFVMLEGLTGHGEEVRSQAALALHYCMMGRSRAASSALLEQSLLTDMVPQLERVLNSENSLFPASSSRPVLSPKLWSSMRLTACKLIDNWIVSIPGCSSVDPVAEETMIPSEEGSSVLQQEDDELREDERVFRRCMGDVADVQLETRFSDRNLQQFVREERQVVGEAGVEDEKDAVDEDPELASQSDATDTISRSASPLGKRAVEVGRKRLIGVILRSDPLGSILSWLLCLQRVDSMAVRSWTLRARCGNFLKKSGILTNALHFLMHVAGDLLKHKKVAGLLQRMSTVDLNLSASEVTALEKATKIVSGEGSILTGTIQQLAVYGLFRSVCTLPAMFRGFWNDDCSRVQKQKLELFVEERVRLSLIGREIGLIASASSTGRWKTEEFRLKGSVVSGEITATFIREETSMEIRIRLPPSYPLKNVEVTCTSKIGVSDGRWRRWVLQMIQLLSLQDGSVVDAALMWKCNVEKELEGVEPCPICYCVLHTKTLGLPALACPTCNNKFHNTCLYTWFKSSGKSKCVICQQPFFAPGQQPRDVTA